MGGCCGSITGHAPLAEGRSLVLEGSMASDGIEVGLTGAVVERRRLLLAEAAQSDNSEGPAHWAIRSNDGVLTNHSLLGWSGQEKAICKENTSGAIAQRKAVQDAMDAEKRRQEEVLAKVEKKRQKEARAKAAAFLQQEAATQKASEDERVATAAAAAAVAERERLAEAAEDAIARQKSASDAELKRQEDAIAEAERNRKQMRDQASADATEAERKRKEAAEAAEAQKRQQQEAAAEAEKKRQQEEAAEAEKKRKLQEEAEKKLQQEKAAEAEKKRQQEEAAEAEKKKKKLQDEAEKKLQQEKTAEAEKKRQQEEAAEAEKKKKLQDEAEKKRQQEEAAEAEKKKKKLQEEAEADKKRQEEQEASAKPRRSRGVTFDETVGEHRTRNFEGMQSKAKPNKESASFMSMDGSGAEVCMTRRELLDEYFVGEMLGEGAFGVVYACREHHSSESLGSETMAVKMIDRVENTLDAIKQEVDLAEKLQHPNVLGCHDVFYEKCFVCIVMDKLHSTMAEGELLHWETKGKIPLATTRLLTAQMGSSLNYLHSLEIVHRDVKCDNFMIDREDIGDIACHVMMMDFGTCVEFGGMDDRLSEPSGTEHYWSPDFYNLDYSYKVDVWAMGIVVYTLLFEEYPFEGEDDVRGKPVSFAKDKSLSRNKEWKSLVNMMLEKDEDKRGSAADVVAHPLLAADHTVASNDVKSSPIKNAASVGESKPSQSVQERRHDLIDLSFGQGQDLSSAMGHKSPAKRGSTVLGVDLASLIPGAHVFKDKFKIMDARLKNAVFRYEWYTEDKFDALGNAFSKSASEKPGGKKTTSVHSDIVQKASLDLVKKQLVDHGIDTSEFGSGEARSLERLASEVESGSSQLMLDATANKKLVRVVEMVAFRICAPPLEGEDTEPVYLFEFGEEMPDETVRELTRLPGSKKQPFENTKQVVERFEKERLSGLDCEVEWDFKNSETFEEELESPSYPGVHTVYRKEIVQGTIAMTDEMEFDNERFQPDYVLESAGKGKSSKKFYKWITKEECDNEEIRYQVGKAAPFSTLVHPPIGMGEVELKAFLIKNKIEVSLFGKGQTKTLRDLSLELVRGESTLINDKSGNLFRVVEPVLLKLVNSEDDTILVQTHVTHPNEAKVELKRLPATKRRPDENVFFAAKKIMRKMLNMEENNVIFDGVNVEFAEEDRISKSYPQLKTIRRKRTVTGHLER